jgi:hypothetical protein
VFAGRLEPKTEECLAALIMTNGDNDARKRGVKEESKNTHLEILDNIQERV